LQHDSTLGVTPDGGLTKLGAGNLTLTAASTYTGNTLVGAGTLTVNGSLAATAVNVATNATLSGSGSLGGSITISNGATLAPGAVGVLGNLTVAGSVTLQGTAAMDLNLSTLTNDVLKAASITFGGTLTVTNLAGTPAGTNTFLLFNAGSYNGNFTATNLPVLASGLAWNWNPANGTLSLVSTGPGIFTNPTGITSFSLSGNGNVVITGTNGQAGDAYYLLETTDLTLPISQWVPVATNVLGASGNFTFTGTNVVTPGDSQQFYLLSNTNN
jgi:autotransporter-associated beta strand protein